MEVKFEMVRIGKKRKSFIAEKILKQNVSFLKESIRHLLKNKTSNSKHNRIFITMVIPARGYNIKIHFQNIPEKWIRKELKDNFPDAIYKGRIDYILDNIYNPIF